MHGFEPAVAANDSDTHSTGPWWASLNRYHWFVLVVAALGWLFDTMDQQLFNLARVPAVSELLQTAPGTPAAKAMVDWYSGISTSIFLMGWATGGLAFGIMGDRVGRAKTMLLTILLYSIFTGLSALSWDVYSFCAFRFLTGLGVGGEFAVGVSLVAEAMPNRARPYALGLLQALSAVGNISAALISIGFAELEESGAIGSAWRWMFVVGAGPALLAILIRRKLKEPEQWSAISNDDVKKQLGSYGELFGDARWRKNALVGLTMAFAGVVGLWGIGFFSFDLMRSVFRKSAEAQVRASGGLDVDVQLLRTVLTNSPTLTDAEWASLPAENQLLPAAKGETAFARVLLPAAIAAHKAGGEFTTESILSKVVPPPNESAKGTLEQFLKQSPGAETQRSDVPSVSEQASSIKKRQKTLNSDVTFWVAIGAITLNVGAFFGMYSFALVTGRIGRRPAFAIAFIAAFASTMLVFSSLTEVSHVFWMMPLMGFCQLSLFSGYAIYFPELFPTRLRSTGTSFCYNVGRFVAAIGPLGLAAFQGVFQNSPEPMRPAGMAMCSIFIIGLLALPFAPETRGKPMPE